MAERKLYRQIYKQDKKRKYLNIFLKFSGFGLLVFTLLFFFVFIFIARDLPRPEKFTERRFVQSTKIYDRTGKVQLYEIYDEEKRTIVSLESIPDYLKKAVIATEDANFYNHFGIDLKGILRSLISNFRVGSLTSYGGSTIDQQLIRSTFLSTEKTIDRKVKEIFLALELDRRYSKDQILEWYLNQVPFGSNCYGVEAASQTYFRKSISEISMAESAALAAMIQAPSYLSPYGEYKEKLLSRKDYVLNRMFKEGYITKEEANNASKEELVFSDLQSIKAPHFVIYLIEKYLKPKYGEDLNYLKEKGVKIYTTIDWDLQEYAEKIVKKTVESNHSFNSYNAAMVAIDPKTGEILSMVGSADWFGESYPKGCKSDCLFDPKFNVTVGTESSPGRQPGSSFKPFVYATAFKKGYTATTTVIDDYTNFGIWGDEEYIPQNYDGLFLGRITLKDSLAQSRNIPAVKVLLDLAEIDDSVKTAQDLGITTLQPPYGPSIVLGGWEVKLLDMVSAYSVFANDGVRMAPSAILKIEDYQGNIIEENKKTPKRVLSSSVAETITDILSDNNARAPIFGYNSALFFENYKVAAKTGTTQDYRDGWAIGYTPEISVGVWAGNSNNESMYKEPGSVAAGPIFHNFMLKALSKLAD